MQLPLQPPLTDAGGADGGVAMDTRPTLARLYGEPVFALPQDLYIPPDALRIFLEAFEGPLDLLLYLIRRQNFNILDIPMAALTRQYLAYVDEIRASSLELAAEYLLMAAMLIEIKSRLLLPPKRSELDASGEAEDPRAALVRRLLVYEQIKLASQQIAAQPQVGRDVFTMQVVQSESLIAPLPEVSAWDLQQAWLAIGQRARLVRHHHISREALSVREHMGSILRRLQGRRFLEFGDLFSASGGLPVLVVTFIALLELAKEGLLELTQAEPFAPVYLRLAYTPA